MKGSYWPSDRWSCLFSFTQVGTKQSGKQRVHVVASVDRVFLDMRVCTSIDLCVYMLYKVTLKNITDSQVFHCCSQTSQNGSLSVGKGRGLRLLGRPRDRSLTSVVECCCHGQSIVRQWEHSQRISCKQLYRSVTEVVLYIVLRYYNAKRVLLYLEYWDNMEAFSKTW